MSSAAPPIPEDAEHLVLLLHGMNTYAHWMNDIKPVLRSHGFEVAPVSYGFFGVPRFLAFPFLRKGAAKRVSKGIDTAVRVYNDKTGRHPKRISIISHSFGTWLIAHALKDDSNIKFFRVIFCGSVVREDFEFERMLHQFKAPILNHIGTKDYWPAVGESAGWGYGSIGSNGINHSAVENRWHDGFRHSDFFTKKFCEDYWVPFLRGDEPKPADPWKPAPFWLRVITTFPLRWLILGIVIAAIFGIAQYLALKIGGFDVFERGHCIVMRTLTSDGLRYYCS
jgi:hypothetical protein